MAELIFENEFIEFYADDTYLIKESNLSVFELAVAAEEFVNFMKHNS